ncbi:hypothetical protein ACFL4O_01280 [bacterium]
MQIRTLKKTISLIVLILFTCQTIQASGYMCQKQNTDNNTIMVKSVFDKSVENNKKIADIFFDILYKKKIIYKDLWQILHNMQKTEGIDDLQINEIKKMIVKKYYKINFKYSSDVPLFDNLNKDLQEIFIEYGMDERILNMYYDEARMFNEKLPSLIGSFKKNSLELKDYWLEILELKVPEKLKYEKLLFLKVILKTGLIKKPGDIKERLNELINNLGQYQITRSIMQFLDENLPNIRAGFTKNNLEFSDYWLDIYRITAKNPYSSVLPDYLPLWIETFTSKLYKSSGNGYIKEKLQFSDYWPGIVKIFTEHKSPYTLENLFSFSISLLIYKFNKKGLNFLDYWPGIVKIIINGGEYFLTGLISEDSSLRTTIDKFYKKNLKFPDYWPNIVEIFEKYKLNSTKYLVAYMPLTIDEFNKKGLDFNNYWPKIVKLFENKNSYLIYEYDIFFTQFLPDLLNALDEKKLDLSVYWPTIERFLTDKFFTKNNFENLYLYLPVVIEQGLIGKPEDLDAIGNQLLQANCYIYSRYSEKNDILKQCLKELKKNDVNGDIKYYWPMIADIIKAKGIEQTCGIIADIAKRLNTKKIKIKDSWNDIGKLMKSKEINQDLFPDVLTPFLTENGLIENADDFKKIIRQLENLNKACGKDNKNLFTENLPKFIEIFKGQIKDQWDNMQEQLLVLSKNTNNYNIKEILDLLFCDDYLKFMKNNNYNLGEYLKFYNEILAKTKKEASYFVLQDILYGITNKQIYMTDKDKILEYIKNMGNFNGLCFYKHKLLGSDKQKAFLKYIKEFGNNSILNYTGKDEINEFFKKLEKDFNITDRNEQKDIFLASIFSVIPIGVSTAYKEEILNVLDNIIDVDYKGHVPEILVNKPFEMCLGHVKMVRGSKKTNKKKDIEDFLQNLTKPADEKDKKRDDHSFKKAVNEWFTDINNQKNKKQCFEALIQYAKYDKILRDFLESIKGTSRYIKLMRLNEFLQEKDIGLKNFTGMVLKNFQNLPVKSGLNKKKKNLLRFQCLKILKNKDNDEQKKEKLENLFKEIAIKEREKVIDIKNKTKQIDKKWKDFISTIKEVPMSVEDISDLLCNNWIKLTEDELKRYKIRDMGNKEITLCAAKDVVHAFMRGFAGECVWSDNILYKNPNYFEFEMTELDKKTKTKKIIGLISLMKVTYEGKERYVVTAIDPIVDFLSTIDNNIFCKEIEKFFRKISNILGSPLLITKEAGDISNRQDIVKIFNQKMDKEYSEIELKNKIVFSISPYCYSFKECYEIPLNIFHEKFKKGLEESLKWLKDTKNKYKKAEVSFIELNNYFSIDFIEKNLKKTVNGKYNEKDIYKNSYKVDRLITILEGINKKTPKEYFDWMKMLDRMLKAFEVLNPKKTAKFLGERKIEKIEDLNTHHDSKKIKKAITEINKSIGTDKGGSDWTTFTSDITKNFDPTKDFLYIIKNEQGKIVGYKHTNYLAVHKDYQGKGIKAEKGVYYGSWLLDYVIRDRSIVYLPCDPHLKKFYDSIGKHYKHIVTRTETKDKRLFYAFYAKRELTITEKIRNTIVKLISGYNKKEIRMDINIQKAIICAG